MFLSEKKIWMVFFVIPMFFFASIFSTLCSNEIEVVSSSIDFIELTYDPNFKGNELININGRNFVKPIFENCDYVANNHNAPMLFIKSVYITLPSQNGFKVNNIRVEDIMLDNGMMAPTPIVVGSSENYEYIDEIYNNSENNNLSNESWINVEYEGISGYRHIARVDFITAKYNPNNQTIERPTNFYIKILFDNKVDKQEQYFINDLETTINHRETRSWLTTKKSQKDKDGFLSKIQDLNDISDGKWLKLGINKEGVYRITASDLQNRGINIPVSQVNTIKIFGQSGKPMSEKISDDLSLNEQKIIVNTNPDGSLASIIFYASGATGFDMNSFIRMGSTVYLQRHYVNYMDNRNYYLLTFGKTDGKRAVPIPTESAQTTSKPTTYKASIFKEEDKYMPGLFGNGLHWLGEPISNSVSMIDNLHNFNGKGNVEYVLSFAHTNPQSSSLSVYQGTNKILDKPMSVVDGSLTTARIFTEYVTTSPTQIGSDNRSVLRFEYNGQSLYPFHNFYEIHYTSNMIPINNEIQLYSNIATFNNSQEIVEYSINGFNGSNIYGFDVSDMSAPELLTNVANTGGIYIFKHKETNSDIKKYFVSSNILSPNIEEITLLNLRNVSDEYYSNVDVIVITPDEFVESAKNYAAYRNKQSGFKVSVVPINKIYAEFSYGRLDLVGVRNYIQYAVENWNNRPSYVVLWGTGHYDFREIENYRNYIPAYQRTGDTYSEVTIGNSITINANNGNYSTDDFYVYVAGNGGVNIGGGKPDVCIGRVPITSNAEGNTYVTKLDQYENHSNKGNWRQNVMIHADDGPASSGNSDNSAHVSGSEGITNGKEIATNRPNIPSHYIVNKVYLPEFPVEFQAAGARSLPQATSEIFNQLNLVGNLMYLFTGHGNTNTLTHEKTFTRDMLPQFTNEDKLFMFAAGSCEVGRFDHKAGTLAGDIVLLPKTGAIVSFAATRVSGPSSNNNIIATLIRNLLNKNQYNTYNTMGEASRITKNTASINSPENRMYILFGDPCLKLATPELSVKIDKINETEIVKDMEPIVVKGMTYLAITGKIVSDSSINTPVADFNGTINVILNEPNDTMIVFDERNAKFTYTKNGSTLNTATFQVIDGKFEIEIIIPADISFSKDKSLLYFYAISDNDRYAIGVNNDILINDISHNSIIDDGKGPEITLHLDSKLFKSGDTVSRNPLLLAHLRDETGINTTGFGIGKKIEARIDDNPIPIDLTSSFASSLTDPKAGDIQKYLGEILPGRHTLTIRAWDVFSNYTDASVEFVIPTEKEEGILRASFTPNPIYSLDKTGGRIAIYYTVNPPIDASVIIYNELGKEVSKFETTITNSGYTIMDFIANDNCQLSPGTYYYHIKFKYNKTRESFHWCEKFGTLGVVVK